MRTPVQLLLLLLLPSPMLAGAVFVDVPLQITNQIVYAFPVQESAGPPPTSLVFSQSQSFNAGQGLETASTTATLTCSLAPDGALAIDLSATGLRTSGFLNFAEFGATAYHQTSFVVPDFGPGMTTLLFSMEVQETDAQDMSIQSMWASLGYVEGFDNGDGLTTGSWPSEAGLVSQLMGARIPGKMLIGAPVPFPSGLSAPENKTVLERSFMAGDTIRANFLTSTTFEITASTANGALLARGTFRVRAVASDSDSDLLADHQDNCSASPNPAQADTDGDQIGNACDCDFNQDGFCSIADFNLFLPDFITSTDGGRGTDMDGDGSVGISDFNLFLPGFTKGKPGPSGLI